MDFPLGCRGNKCISATERPIFQNNRSPGESETRSTVLQGLCRLSSLTPPRPEIHFPMALNPYVPSRSMAVSTRVGVERGRPRYAPRCTSLCSNRIRVHDIWHTSILVSFLASEHMLVLSRWRLQVLLFSMSSGKGMIGRSEAFISSSEDLTN